MHEIRNPINGISMNMYLLAEAAENNSHWTEEEQESLQLINKEIARLDSLIKNALSYARKVELNFDRVLLSELFHDLYELVVYQAEEKKVDLVFEGASDHLSGYFDENLIKQVLLNLLQNAIDAAAASDRRSVRLRVSVEEAPKWRYISESARVLHFAVENSGERISDTVRLNLFKPFFTTKGNGLGLGLATSAKIVRQHHGIIAHEHSHAAPYTTVFTVALPM
jgi:signal transduction histidine kinase